MYDAATISNVNMTLNITSKIYTFKVEFLLKKVEFYFLSRILAQEKKLDFYLSRISTLKV